LQRVIDLLHPAASPRAPPRSDGDDLGDFIEHDEESDDDEEESDDDDDDD
jgi:hypothetical protein